MSQLWRRGLLVPAFFAWFGTKPQQPEQNHNDKRVYGWGCVLGKAVDRPTPLPNAANWVQVHVGEDGVGVAIDSQGALWQFSPEHRRLDASSRTWQQAQSVWGKRVIGLSTSGQLYQIGDHDRPLLENEEVVSLACGREHCVAVSKQGKAFTAALTNWAYRQGQLGLGEAAPPLPSKEDAPRMADLDSWRLMRGEGHDDPSSEGREAPPRIPLEEIVFRPVPLPTTTTTTTSSAKHIVQAHCGDNHTVLLDHEGGVWAFGSNQQQQLGLSNKEAMFVVKPTLTLTLTQGVSLLAAGGDNTMAYTRDGNLLVCGAGLRGQHGNGHRRHVSEGWQPLPSLSQRRNPDGTLIAPLQLAVGQDHLGVLMNTADPIAGFGYDLRLWGGNQAGQLGIGKRTPVCEPISPLGTADSNLIYQGGQLQIPQTAASPGQPLYRLYLGPQVTFLY